MRQMWRILLGAALPVVVLAQDQQPPVGIVIREFSITDSPCGFKHDSSVEKAVQAMRVVVNTGKHTGATPSATLELRNNSVKTITAYIFNYTFTHAGKTDYYSGHGADLVYEMAFSKGGPEQTLPNSIFPPGGALTEKIYGGRGRGEFDVYPCMVAFDDGTFIGPPFLMKALMGMRADNAKAFGALVVDLKSARDSADPKTFLTNRAKQIKRITRGRSGEEPYRYLEIVASSLSPSGSTPLDKKTITAHISALKAQQETLVRQSKFTKTE